MALVTIPAPREWDTTAPHLRALVEEVRELLVERQMPVGRVVHLAPGIEPAWDDCCSGMLYSRIIRFDPVYDGPRNAQGRQCSIVRYDILAGIGIVRCAHSVDNQGRAPAPSKITADGYDMTADLHSVLRILECSQLVSRIDRWQPAGPEGGCHGGEWQFQLVI